MTDIDHSEGWIKLHRKIIHNPIFKNPKVLTLWVYLLLRANHSNTKTIIGNNVIPINRGQFLTGRKTLSNETGLPETTLERLLSLLESEHMIGQQKHSKYRLISITNYDKHQGSGQQTDNKWTTNGQQTDTDKNVNNANNEKKKEIVIPNGINLKAWKEWTDYRKSKKKPVSEKAAKKQFELLIKYNEQEQQAIIDKSITNDYQGLFSLGGKDERRNQKPPRKSAAERTIENIQREFGQGTVG